MPYGIRFVRPWKATGRMRLRSSWFGMVVAEIEEEQETRFQASPASEERLLGVSTRWRRARSRDIARNLEVVLR